IGTGGPVDRGLAWRQMATFVGEWSLHGHGMWAVASLDDGRLLGRAGFLQPPGWPEVELGWLLAREAWGRGFATEAVAAARAHGRDRLGLRAPISLIRPENARSIALAERLGARLEARVELLGGVALQYRHPG
ncbi:MAG TPA: GNAT family N-acetyltransferase, partial [Burkholderiaceae bacterium]|nr:GNAT family N-acetyltransferase [Burkholderiaceae bacterium]